MNNMELETDIEALDMEMGDVTIHYCPVIPNPEGEPTAELKTAEIEGEIYEIVDEEARTALENKVDKEEGKGLSENDYTDEDKAIVDGVTTALDGKADKSDTYTKSQTDTLLSAKANSSDLSTVATSGSYNDLSDTPNLSTVATSGDYNDLENKPNLSTVATSGSYDDLTDKPTIDTAISPTSTNAVQNKAIYNLLNDLLPEATETGNPIAITNASGLNAKSLKVELEPIQDLNGYDSPWVGGSGKNKFNKEAVTIHDRRIATSTGGVYTSNGYSVSPFISVQEGILYTLTTTVTSYIAWYSSDSQSSFISGDSWLNQTSKTVPTGATHLRFDFPTDQADNVQLEIGSSATSYAPYSNICPISGRTSLDVTVNGETETLNFSQTVYGGTCDVVNGETSETWKKLDLGSIVWTTPSASGISYSTAITDFKQVTTGQIHFGNAVFDNYEFVQSVLYDTDNGKASLYYHTGSSGYRLFVCDTNLIGKTAPQVATYMSGKYICYEKATPTTLTTPATPISLNKGNNTLSTSGDNMVLIYSKIPQ